ncbi:MAG: universal stress protein [Deltaproteobacteria bacterium]|nr:universal stress protein [Deltaproteobacteria bacterium]
MNQRIVVGLDGTEYSKSAIRWACVRAKTFGGIVIGVAVVDVPGIEKSEVGSGVGGNYYARKAIDYKLEDASTHTAEFIKTFEKKCTDEGVPYETYLKMGEPVDIFKEEGKTADLIIMGLRTYFKFLTTEAPDEGCIRKLLLDPVCPVIGVPKIIEPHETIIICFNGSSASARAMRSYAQLSQNIPASYRVILLNVNDSAEEAEYLLTRAEKYLNSYGIRPEKVWRTGNVEDAIFAKAKKYKPTPLVVLGAYSDKARYIFGRRTTKLMEDGTIPIFVYH